MGSLQREGGSGSDHLGPCWSLIGCRWAVWWEMGSIQLADSSSLSCHIPLRLPPCSEEFFLRWGEEEVEGWKTRTCAGGGWMGLEEVGLWWGPSVLGEEGWGVGAFCGVNWFGFCVAAGREEVDPCGNQNWSLDGAGRLSERGVEGRRGVAPWGDLKRYNPNPPLKFSCYIKTTEICKFDATEYKQVSIVIFYFKETIQHIWTLQVYYGFTWRCWWEVTVWLQIVFLIVVIIVLTVIYTK